MNFTLSLYTEYGDEIKLNQKCYECNGKGEYNQEYFTKDNKIEYKKVRCENCYGTGKELTENGRTLLEFIEKYKDK